MLLTVIISHVLKFLQNGIGTILQWWQTENNEDSVVQLYNISSMNTRHICPKFKLFKSRFSALQFTNPMNIFKSLLAYFLELRLSSDERQSLCNTFQ